MDYTDEVNDEQTSNNNDNVQQEDDIDTSLLCPDVIIDEKNDAIVTGNDSEDECDLLNGSPFDYNITGVKAHFFLNTEEDKFRKEIYKNGNFVQNTKIHCTSCNIHLGSALNTLNKVYVHPLLNVLLCKKCFEFYSGGKFEKDEDGAERYCRWCGQGGQVFCCSRCPRVFCKLCIRLNFSSTQYREIRDSDYWECFVCDTVPIMHLRAQCFEFTRYVQSELKRLQHIGNGAFYMGIDHSSCCLNLNAQKRKIKNEDPDFVPYYGENYEKPSKRLKIPKNGNVVQLKNVQTKAEEKEVLISPSTSKTEYILDEPYQNLPKIPYRIPSIIQTTSSSSTVPSNQILIQQITLGNQVYRNKYLAIPALSSQFLASNRTLTTSVAPMAQHLPIPRIVHASLGQHESQSPPLTMSTYLAPTISQNATFLKPNAPQQQLVRFKIPSKPLFTPLVANKNTACKHPVVESERFDESQQQKYFNFQPQSVTKKVEDFASFLNKSRQIDRLMLATALSNSSCASTILNLYELCDGKRTANELITLHDSLQTSLKTMTDSLIDIKNQLNSNPVGLSPVIEGSAKTSAVKRQS